MLTSFPLQIALWSVLGAALLISVITDLTCRLIFDWVTYPALALLLGFRFWGEGLGNLDQGLVSGLVAAAGSAGILALVTLLGGGFGWGDVKLLGVMGAALGYPLALAALLFISLVGALQALASLVWQGALWQTLSGALSRLGAKLGLRAAPEPVVQRRIPYGLAIALGSVWAIWWEHSAGLNS